MLGETCRLVKTFQAECLNGRNPGKVTRAKERDSQSPSLAGERQPESVTVELHQETGKEPIGLLIVTSVCGKKNELQLPLKQKRDQQLKDKKSRAVQSTYT